MRILDDFKAYAGNSLGKGISTIFLNPCFHSIVLYRLSCTLYRIHLKLPAKIVWYVNRILFNVDLDFRSNIGGGFRLIHGLNVVVGCEVNTGKNLTLYQGVTLGGNRNQKKIIRGVTTGQPFLGNGVTIYTDAKVFGPVNVPDECQIKAGSLITKDIESALT